MNPKGATRGEAVARRPGDFILLGVVFVVVAVIGAVVLTPVYPVLFAASFPLLKLIEKLTHQEIPR